MLSPDKVSLRPPISAFVISYNRAETLGTCLRGLGFADEIIVVDKSSTDGSADVARPLADRVINVPWSPTVEETREFAASQCSYEWVLFLDDDECLSVEAADFIVAELSNPRADIYAFGQRHYILGVHDEGAYYWPDYQIRLFRKGAIEFTPTVHDGTKCLSEKLHQVSASDGACIHHLSHRDARQWIEKVNRYTSRPDRARMGTDESDLISYAHRQIDAWALAKAPQDRGGYVASVGILRAVYDIVDRIKSWEEARKQDGEALFAGVRNRLDAQYAQRFERRRKGEVRRASLLERLSRRLRRAASAPQAINPSAPATDQDRFLDCVDAKEGQPFPEPNDARSAYRFKLNSITLEVPYAALTQAIWHAIQHGYYEGSERDALKYAIRPGDGIVEIGGGLGYISALVSRNFQASRITTVEADEMLIPIIHRTHALNGIDATVYHAAATELGQPVTFYRQSAFWASSTVPLPGSKSVTVPGIALQRLIDEGNPDVLIADVEGAEKSLFRNLKRRQLRHVVVEVHKPNIGIDGIRACFDDLHDAGFAYDPDGSAGTNIVFSRRS